MDVSIFFQPVDHTKEDYPEQSLGNLIQVNSEEAGFPDLDEVHLALIGVCDDRATPENLGAAKAADALRPYLYKLYQGKFKLEMADLGNIVQGETLKDTYAAVSTVASELIRQNVLPIIIGGGQDLTYANYLAYEKLERVINIAAIDPAFDLGESADDIHSGNYLNKIILHQPNYLFNYSNVGFQTYFVSDDERRLIDDLYFDAHRLGEIRAKMREVEPIVRNADLLTFDMTAIRMSDAPGNKRVTPNGFYGEEACQITRYAGLSDKLSSIGFYEFNPDFDPRGQTAHLLAQMVWYFIEGFYGRKKEFPMARRKDFFKYRINLDPVENELIFYKSLKSDRWWMDIPYPPNKRMRFQRHHLVPCSYSDYQVACNSEVPDKWWQAYQKLS